MVLLASQVPFPPALKAARRKSLLEFSALLRRARAQWDKAACGDGAAAPPPCRGGGPPPLVQVHFLKNRGQHEIDLAVTLKPVGCRPPDHEQDYSSPFKHILTSSYTTAEQVHSISLSCWD